MCNKTHNIKKSEKPAALFIHKNNLRCAKPVQKKFFFVRKFNANSSLYISGKEIFENAIDLFCHPLIITTNGFGFS